MSESLDRLRRILSQRTPGPLVATEDKSVQDVMDGYMLLQGGELVADLLSKHNAEAYAVAVNVSDALIAVAEAATTLMDVTRDGDEEIAKADMRAMNQALANLDRAILDALGEGK